MAKDIQSIFNKMQKSRKEQKEIRAAYKEALLQTPGYDKMVEDLNTLRAKKKDLELAVKSDFSTEFDKLEDLKLDLESDQEMINDIAINKLMKGETVQLKDEYDNEYEPRFAVKFKKVYL